MSKNSDLRIAVEVMDPAALMGIKRLIRLDPRVNAEGFAGFTDPRDLAKALNAAPAPFDVVLVDAESYFNDPPQHLDEYLRALKIDRRITRLVCLANRADPDLLLYAVKGGAHGLLLKRDVTPGLLHAALRAQEGTFLFSEGLRAQVEGQHTIKNTTFAMVPGWRKHPHLTVYGDEIINSNLIHGETVVEISRRLKKKPDAVEQALYRGFEKIIESSFYSEIGMENLKLTLSLQQQAYLYYTGLPRSLTPEACGWQERKRGRPRKVVAGSVKTTSRRSEAAPAHPQEQL